MRSARQVSQPFLIILETAGWVNIKQQKTRQGSCTLLEFDTGPEMALNFTVFKKSLICFLQMWRRPCEKFQILLVPIKRPDEAD